MNIRKIASIVLIICGFTIILIGFALASGESNVSNLKNAIYGLTMITLGMFFFCYKRNPK